MSWLGKFFASSDRGSVSSEPPPTADLEGDDLLERAEDALRTVIDPEIGINIVDLGLLYGLRTGEGVLEAEIGLTSPSCPLGEFIAGQARDALAGVVGDPALVRVELLRDRKWDPSFMSSEARRQLGRG